MHANHVHVPEMNIEPVRSRFRCCCTAQAVVVTVQVTITDTQVRRILVQLLTGDGLGITFSFVCVYSMFKVARPVLTH